DYRIEVRRVVDDDQRRAVHAAQAIASFDAERAAVALYVAGDHPAATDATDDARPQRRLPCVRLNAVALLIASRCEACGSGHGGLLTLKDFVSALDCWLSRWIGRVSSEDVPADFLRDYVRCESSAGASCPRRKGHARSERA